MGVNQPDALNTHGVEFVGSDYLIFRLDEFTSSVFIGLG